MKNIKKTIIGVAILAISLVGIMMGNVNAASVVAAKEVKKGKNVTVSVNLEKAASAIEFKLKYDPKVFEFVSAVAGDLGTPTANNKPSEGVVVVVAAAMNGKASTSNLTFQFKAKETTQEGVPFTISELITNQKEDISSAIANVKVIEESKEPEAGNQGNTGDSTNVPTQTVDNKEDTKTSTTNNNKNPNQIIATNGKVIKKLPQTGTPVFIGAAVLIGLAGTVLVIRKIK